MKFKIIILLFVVALGVFSFFVIATKATTADYGLSDSGAKAGYIADAKEPNVGQWADLLSLVGQVLGIVLAMIGVALFGLMLYGGGRWLIARGNQEDITKAQDIIQAALIGMAIIFVSLGVGNWVIGKLAGGGSGGHGEVGCTPKYTDVMTAEQQLAVQQAQCGDKDEEQCLAETTYCDWKEGGGDILDEVPGKCMGGDISPDQFCTSFCNLQRDQDVAGVCDGACSMENGQGVPGGQTRFSITDLCAEADTQDMCGYYSPYCFWQPD
ncbi:MAG: hypothetical protein A3J93_02360 [Candidatus Magasanikbacteria bacterium RIFOXYC2_FULL_42_28]|uniref:Uncharacterized protein n=1 Tax=Candidatus Magasanikbacteria bacterium RIFOXYC2_FULL_42_28 TaxID=1798704 RepID=A0A1F6NVM0_9BACT|nr:MAG: hypothetical protein A3J93_02360 [Candidatus Magasanikbacteria bacterium RIFOXYC2_FULL_42_28]